jgi:hypothetical protein
MLTVYKYLLPLNPGIYERELPVGAKLLNPAIQRVDVMFTGIVFWAQVDTEQPFEKREFLVQYTGNPWTKEEVQKYDRYMGTVMRNDGHIYHIFTTSW